MRPALATVRKRMTMLLGVFFLLFLCVCARLFVLQVLRAQELTARGTAQWTRSGIVAARRGDILDANGEVLAQSVTSFIASARMRDVTDAKGMARVLARELGLDEQALLKKQEERKTLLEVRLI